jgi:hypothetical protein
MQPYALLLLMSVLLVTAHAQGISGTDQKQETSTLTAKSLTKEAEKLEEKLLKAVRKGDDKEIRSLIAQGVDVKRRRFLVHDIDNLRSNNISKKYDFELVPKDGGSDYMHEALTSGQVKSVQALVELGIDAHEKFFADTNLGCIPASSIYYDFGYFDPDRVHGVYFSDQDQCRYMGASTGALPSWPPGIFPSIRYSYGGHGKNASPYVSSTVMPSPSAETTYRQKAEAMLKVAASKQKWHDALQQIIIYLQQ